MDHLINIGFLFVLLILVIGFITSLVNAFNNDDTISFP